MKNGKKLISQNQSGFTLTEVMIALFIFAVFSTNFIVGQGSNIASSAQMREELILQNLCEEALNEIILNPPAFREALTLSKETKQFEKDGFENYEYIIEFRKLELPNLAQIKGQDESESEEGDNKSSVTTKVFDQLKKNIEKMIWQIIVTTRNKETGLEFTLSTWLTNEKAKVQINF